MGLHDEASVCALTLVNGLLVMERAPAGLGRREGWAQGFGCADDRDGGVGKTERKASLISYKNVTN